MNRDDIRRKLAEPFDPAAISWRVGATNSDKTRGLALAYLDARDVMNRLDDVMGVFGWQSEHSIIGDRTMCRLSLRDPETGQWVARTDGAGDTDVEAEKGAFSSSLKRCAVNFGIGRYLYDLDSPWVALEQKGKSQVIPERELARLRGILAGKAQANVETPTWPAATPPRPTTAGSRSIPSGSPAGENAATRDATSAALSPTPSSAGNGGTPPNIAKFLAGESYEIDPQVAGGVSAWERYYLKIAAAAENFEQYAKLQNDNEVQIQKFARAVRREVFDDFLKRCQAIEAKYFPNEPPLVSKADADTILQG